jgi:lipopolysaccharide export system protein LptA
LPQTGRADFIGNVRFTDKDRTLTAQQAQYISAERRIMAQQNVVLTNRRDGSTLRGNFLDYFQPSPTYPEGRVDVGSGRPRGTIIRQRANSAAIDTTVIDADRMQIVGEHTFRGWGNVQTRRGTMSSQSQFAEFNEQANRMVLSGQATVQSDTFRLRADSIDAVVMNGDEFRELHAFRGVLLESEGVDLNAPIVRLYFEKGQVEKLFAIGGKKISPDAPQARSVSPDFVLTADSIDALSPQEKLQRVFAIGRARGERFGDTITDRSLPELIRNDWVQGDTVRAYFTERKPGARPAGQAQPVSAVGSDSTRVIERIVAVGAPASSTYRMREQVGDTIETSVNYLTARKLDVTFKDGAVHKVAAEGEIRGLYLQPPARAAATNARRP